MIKKIASVFYANGMTSLLALVFLGLMLASAPLVQAGGFALSGVGSKAIGMGGAFRGLADDWSAAYWNPAGLAQLEKSEINGMLVTLSPKIEYTPNFTYNGLDIGYRNGSVRYPNEKNIFIPDFSGFFKINALKDYTVGLAIFAPLGLSSEWDLMNPNNPDLSTDLAHEFPFHDHEAELAVIDFHPTIARAFSDGKFSVGAGLSIQRGSITFRKTYLQPSGLPIPHENLYIDGDLEGTGWGFGANLGILYKLSDKMQFGISGKTGTTLDLDGTATQELYTLSNLDLQNILLDNAYTALDSAQIYYLFALENHVATPSASGKLKTPADIGLGLAYKPSSKLTLTGDITYTLWSSLDKIELDLSGIGLQGTQIDTTSVIYLNWDNTLRFSLGAEYWVKDPFAIRLGYYFDPTPIPDETFTVLIPDIGDKHSINIGSALLFYGMELSYNFEYLMFKDREVTTLTDANDDGAFDNYPGLYKMKLYASHISLTYRF